MAFPPAYNGFSTEQGVTMALSQSQKIIAFLEKHRGGSFTARQIAEAIVQQYASDYAKKRNNPRFADDKAFLSQIIAEIGSQKDTLKRLRPTLVWQDRPKPRRYCIPLEETQEALDTAQGETCERDEEICACEERALLEQELYPLHQLSLVGAAPLLHAHPGRPLPQYAGKRRQPVAPPRHRGDGAGGQGMGETRQSLRARQRQHLRPALVV